MNREEIDKIIAEAVAESKGKRSHSKKRTGLAPDTVRRWRNVLNSVFLIGFAAAVVIYFALPDFRVLFFCVGFGAIIVKLAEFALRLLFVFLLLCLPLAEANAQRIISELETNSDLSMDSRPDSVASKKSQIVPTEVYAWTVDGTFGNIRPAVVDTLQHHFMNKDLPEGEIGQYNTLGNVGSPRQSRIFMERPDIPDFMFTIPYDMFFVSDDFKYYNTKSPFLNAVYDWSGSKNTGADHVKVTYTNNAGKRFNFGGIFDYIYGLGYYNNQATSYMNASAWASYISDKYDFHLSYQHNFMKTAENGGIEDETYITNPESVGRSFTSNDIPTLLSNTWNRQEHDLVFFNHHYNIGFYRDEVVDSVTTNKVFVPVSRVFHTLKVQNMMRNHKAYSETANYHSYTFLPGDSANDYTKYLNVRNLVGVSLCEGFHKWAVFGLSAYAGFECSRFTLPDTTQYGGFFTNTRNVVGKERFHTRKVFVGGQIVRQKSDYVTYDVNAELVVGGADLGEFEASGNAQVNIPVFGDTARFELSAFVRRKAPSFYFDHYRGHHTWWDQSMDKEWRSRVEGVLDIPHTHTRLSAGVENIKNYCYFQNTGAVLPSGYGMLVSNNVSSLQYGGSIQVVSARIRQDFRLGILHWENDVTWQACSRKEILPLPTLSLYSNLYLKFDIAHVLNTELGADVRYFTEYYAPDYSPSIGMFMNQNENKKVSIGNYPLVSVYANFNLKRTRFYVMYHHANQSDGRYFGVPGYPMNPSSVRFGLSWNFYD